MKQSEAMIHPTAVIEAGAELGVGVEVGPYCMIGANVKIGNGTRLHSHVVIMGHTTLGENNEIFPFASIGHAPQDLKYKGEPTLLKIGDRNRIRECVTLQPGTVQGGGVTEIGDGNLFMAYVHVAHDCKVGNENVFGNCTQLAGHVTIENMAVFAGSSAVHQFCRVGDLGMTGGGSMVTQDIPPYCIVQGDRAVLRGLNVVAMKRRGLSSETITAVKSAFRTLFRAGIPTIGEAVAEIEKQGLLSRPEVAKFVNFVQTSQRGVCRPSVDSDSED